MTQVVWKFEFDLLEIHEDDFTIEMPKGAQILSLQSNVHMTDSPSKVLIWALVDPDAPKELRKMSVRGTGHLAEGLEDVPFLGTAQLHTGMRLVFHFWDGWPAR